MNDKQARATLWLIIAIAVLTFIAAQWGKAGVTLPAGSYTSSTASGPPSPQGEG